MWWYSCLLILSGCGFIKITRTTEIPDYIHICKRSDPKLTECIVEAVDSLMPKLQVGIPEIAAPPIEPFLLNNITIFSGENAADFKANLYNVRVKGVSNFHIDRLRISLGETLVIRCSLSFPLLDILADYDISGRIIFLRLEGNGKFVGNATNVDAKTIMRAEVVQNGDHRQMKFKSMDVRIKVGDYNVVLENLFGGDPILGRATNEVINEAKDEMLGVVIPLLEKEFAKIIVDFANRITEKFDYDEIFPEK